MKSVKRPASQRNSRRPQLPIPNHTTKHFKPHHADAFVSLKTIDVAPSSSHSKQPYDFNLRAVHKEHYYFIQADKHSQTRNMTRHDLYPGYVNSKPLSL